MINPEIAKLMIGLTEDEAKNTAKSYGCSYRVLFRNGVRESTACNDRNDDRYNLVMEAGRVAKVMAG